MPAVPFANTEVRINPGAVAEFMRSPDGPLLRKMIVVGDTVKTVTQAQLKAGFPRDFLAPQIVKRIEVTSEGPRVLVGAVRTRTEPHPIVGNPLLVFYWPRVGKVVAFPRVNHPGSNFGRYLSEKLLASLALIRGRF